MGLLDKLFGKSTKAHDLPLAETSLHHSLPHEAVTQAQLPIERLQIINGLEQERVRLNEAVNANHLMAQQQMAAIAEKIKTLHDNVGGWGSIGLSSGFPGKFLSQLAINQASKLGLPLSDLPKCLALSPFFVFPDTKVTFDSEVTRNLTILLNALLSARPPGVTLNESLVTIIGTCLSLTCFIKEVWELKDEIKVLGFDLWLKLSLGFKLPPEGSINSVRIAEDGKEYAYALGHLQNQTAVPLLQRARKSSYSLFPVLVALCKLGCKEELREVLGYLSGTEDTRTKNLVHCLRLGLLYDQDVAKQLELLAERTQDNYLRKEIEGYFSDKRDYLEGFQSDHK